MSLGAEVHELPSPFRPTTSGICEEARRKGGGKLAESYTRAKEAMREGMGGGKQGLGSER